ncbi:Ig-like domain-containing protein [Motilimonas sp. 1_MG-2023]|uniref:Ig-like domain-containing protein n=1 Tax=Motilimonas sp. 1_MG-2023 TaxID=3062672 RepID=UPI0026E15C0F|nr:Ig-like domain-containing protein [Motilimonas sp. 1_MG-2023]MDO6525574.1 Ig-like domain-containing protein [Motilimonas sp. 1_MG-2023]
MHFDFAFPKYVNPQSMCVNYHKMTKLALFMSIIYSTHAAAGTYNFSSVSGDGTATLTTTVDGITLTATQEDGNNINVTSGFLDPSAAIAEKIWTIAFNSPVNITQFQMGEFSNLSVGTYIFTPDSGTAVSIDADDPAIVGAIATLTPGDWASVNSVTMSYINPDNAMDTFRVGLDNIQFTAAPTDSTDPTFDSGNSTPNDDATGVSVSNNIVIDFDEDIALGTGNITVRDVTGSSDTEVFNVATESDGANSSPGAGRIGIVNDKVYLNPTSDLTGNRNYAIRVDATAIDDTSGNSFAGISDDTTFNFSTANTIPDVDLNSGTGGKDNSVSFTEGSGALNIAPSATVTEADGDTITTITVSLTNDQDGASEGLNVTAAVQDALTGISGSSDITLQDTISVSGATASAAEVQTFLQNISYNNTSSSPNETARTVTVVINDGTANSTSRTATISVSNVTSANSTGAGFNTTNGTNLSPAITFTDDNETLAITNTSHATGSTADGGNGTDTLFAVDNVDLTGLTSLTNFETLTPDNDGALTLSESQHESFSTINGTGDNQFTIASANGDQSLTGDADIETYVLGAAMTFNAATAAQNVTGSSGDDTVNIAALTATGTLSGGTGTDTLQLSNGANISGATVAAFEALTLANDASVTMTETQHDGFSTITAPGAETITISSATDGLTGNSAIETYVLATANTFTLGSTGQNLTGSGGDDTVNVGALSATGTLAGGVGTDTLSIDNGASIAGATVSGFENLAVASGGAASIDAAQLSAFSGTISGAGSETLTIAGDGDITTVSAIESYTLADDSTNTRTVTVSNSSHSVTGTSTSDAVTFDLGALTYTGTISGENTTSDTLSLSSGADITGATINSVANLTLASGASVAMTLAQHGNFTGTLTAAGVETISLSGDGNVTTLAAIENYNLADDSSNTRTITVASDTTSVTANSASDAVTFAIGGSTFTGTLSGENTVADRVQVSDGADITGGSFFNIGTLSLNSGATVAIDSANIGDFTSAITGASGSETLKLMDGGTFNFSATSVSAIDAIALGTNSASTITLTDNFNADGQTVAITNTTGSAITNDLSINASAFVGDVLSITATDLGGDDTFVGGSGADIIRPGAGTDTMTGNAGGDNFIGSASDLSGDTIADLAIGDQITITGVTGLSSANVRFNGSSTLEVDTDATDFNISELSLSLTNAPAASLAYTVADSGSDTVITFIAPNEAPVFSSLNGGATFVENGSAVSIDNDMTVADTELDALNGGNGNYDGATVTLARSGGANSQDVFSHTGLLGSLVQGNTFTYNASSVGTVTTNSGGTLVLTFNSNATSAIVDGVLQSIGYRNSSEDPASSVTLNFTFNDGTIDSTGSNQAVVNITAQNESPNGQSQTVLGLEDAPVSFQLTGSDAEQQSLTFAVSTQPQHGTVTLSGNQGVYQGEQDYFGTDSFTYTVNDGQLSSNPAKVTINLSSVNDAPTISGKPTLEIDVGKAYKFVPVGSDVDGDKLTFSISDLPKWASFDSVSGALSGTPSLANVGKYDAITISVSDGSERVSLPAFAIRVNFVNSAPIARDMLLTAKEDETMTALADVQDADGQSLSIEIVQPPTAGSVEVQGNSFVYKPNANVFGQDGFTYQVSDGIAVSQPATVRINVLSVNDLPQANNDVFELNHDDSLRYELDVLANDTDADGEPLTITSAQASVGSVAIANGKLIYQAKASTQGEVKLTYRIQDKAQASSQGTVSLRFLGGANAAPTIEIPQDVRVNATGLFTKVDLGVAKATDAQGNVLPVSLVNNTTLFAPGKHLVHWQATDNQGRQVIATQVVEVDPLISLQKDTQVIEGASITVKVHLNGLAPSYPVTVPYTVLGSADSGDHDLSDGEIIITQGLVGEVTFNVFDDAVAEGTETIQLQLLDGINLGAKSTMTISIVEENVAPKLQVAVTQDGQTRHLVVANDQLVTLTATATDINIADRVALDFTANGPITLIPTNEDSIITFSPAQLPVGVYKIAVTATDDGTPSLISRSDVYIEVFSSLVALTEQDTDGDLIPDDKEGYGDTDKDGIPDYLDSINECNVLQEQVGDATQFLVEGEPGGCLRKGATVAQNQTGGAQLLASETPVDEAAQNTGGIFDFIITELPQAGDAMRVVLPQRLPIPANAVYRKYLSGQWRDFVSTAEDRVFSSPGEAGYCPPPGDAAWAEGLTEGHWCVQLQIVDGGPNDDDGVINSTIVDPGGVAIMRTSNNLPLAQADAVNVAAGNSITINVLANDSDADGDALVITSATVDFGSVSIVSNQLLYVPATNFVGRATIQYGISDQQGGTASNTVTVDVVVNNPPVANADSATTTDQVSIVINVLSNDSDAEGGVLSVLSVSAVQGQVSVGADGTLTYSPKLGFEGVDIITYIIQDELGARAQGEVKVSVTVYQKGTDGGKSSGGSIGFVFVGLMLAAVVIRRKKPLWPVDER